MLLGKSFMPTMDEGDLIMQLEKLPSISLDQTIAIDSAVQQAILAKVPEVKAIVARAGSDELGLDPMGLNQTDTFMVLQPRATWRNPDPGWLADQLRAVMADFPGVGFSFTQPIDMRVSEMLTGVRGDLAIKVFGPDLATLNKLAVDIENTVKKVPGAEDTFTLKNDGVQYLKVAVDRLAAHPSSCVARTACVTHPPISPPCALVCRMAVACRWLPSPKSSASMARSRSTVRMPSVTWWFNPTSVTAIWSALLKMPKPVSPVMSNCHPATVWPGVASSRTSNARRRA
jgi:hypothetical protein